MSSKRKRYIAIAFAISLVILLYPVEKASACYGKDVMLSDFDSNTAKNGPYHRIDDEGNLWVDKSIVKINPAQAQAIAEKYVLDNYSNPPLPLSFRKLELVHRKLVYQFESEPVKGYNGLYHLGPVNFKVEKLVLDVDALTGNLYLANGCGAGPAQSLYTFDPGDFTHVTTKETPVLVSNNTNFIARKTGNRLKIDGKITPEEWKDTGHRYFYLGTYKEHESFKEHKEPYYYAEIWTQIDDENIYFAVKTDVPYWVGLMFKNDANLGMLGAYTDAKVMRSKGEVSDRHFIRRPDKTFYLERDKTDNILSHGNFENDFYTYEFAIPLHSGDEEDIQFEVGKAYNMLLVIGNTLEHYGIFTLDKAHANHAHSKNNREHADVWASNETTFRIGTPAERDIFGNPATTAFASYDSGFDPAKDNNHFHYAGISLKDFSGRLSIAVYMSLFSVFLALIGAGIIILRFRSQPYMNPGQRDSAGFDLMRIGWVKRFVTWKHFRNLFVIPTLIIFLIIIYLGFFDVQDGQRNIATVFTWTLWWSLIIFTFIIAGRLWCMMCPFAAIGDLVQRFIGLNRELPRWLQNMGLQTVEFILLTWAFTILAFGSRPFITAVVIVSILAAAVIFSAVYERRSFCRHICPIGSVIGIYSMVSPIELRPCIEGRCEVHNQKTCGDACPMLEHPHEMDSNVYCNFCMKCQPACPSQNLGLRLRSFGKDIYASLHKSRAEALAALFLLGVVIVETLAMTSSWRPLENALSSLLGINSSTAIYTISLSLIILIPVGFFYVICYLLKLWLDKEKYRTQDLVTEFAFVLIPLGIALHFAHNLQHLLIESPIAVPATIRFLQNIGIATSLSIDWNPAPLLGLKSIFFIQMSIVMAGFGLTMYVLYRLLRRFQKPLNHTFKMVTVMSLYALLIVLSSIYILGLPMGGRHIH